MRIALHFPPPLALNHTGYLIPQQSKTHINGSTTLALKSRRSNLAPTSMPVKNAAWHLAQAACCPELTVCTELRPLKRKYFQRKHISNAGYGDRTIAKTIRYKFANRLTTVRNVMGTPQEQAPVRPGNRFRISKPPPQKSTTS
jgi:hypothetical protein